MRASDHCTINLLGVTYNTNNYGVRVLLSAVIQCLSRSHPFPDIRVLDYGHDSCVWTEEVPSGNIHIDLINLRYSWRLHLRNNIVRVLLLALLGRIIPWNSLRLRIWCRNPWLFKILQADVNMSLAGGDSFSDIYGVGRLVYVLLPQILVLILGKPLVQLPQTYGPFDKALSRFLARCVLRNSTFIYSRDQEGLKTISDLIGQNVTVIRHIPDVGFAMQDDPIDDKTLEHLQALRRRGLLVGVNISSLLYMGGYTRNNMFGLLEDYPTLIRRLLDSLTRREDCHILLVPHVYGGPESEESEVTLYRTLMREFEFKYPGQISFLDKHYSHRQVKSLIGMCDLFIGSRMHACIASVSNTVPTLCLAYSAKFSGVMRSVSMGIRVVDLRTAKTEDVLESTRALFGQREEIRAQLNEAIPEVIASIESIYSGRDTWAAKV